MIELTPFQYKCYREALSRFMCIHGVNYIAHEEMLKAFDLMEDIHRDRFLVGKLKKKAESQWDVGKNYMLQRLPDAFWAYYVDYGNKLYSGIERKLEFLTGAVCESVKRKETRTPDDLLYARCITTRIMLVHAAYSYVGYFEHYKNVCGFDFSPFFRYADLTPLARIVDQLVEKIRPHQNSRIWDDKICNNAYNTVIDILSDKEFFDNAAYEAKMQNSELSKRLIASQLSNKFTIKK